MFVFDRVFGFDLCIYKVDGLAVFLSFVCTVKRKQVFVKSRGGGGGGEFAVLPKSYPPT